MATAGKAPSPIRIVIADDHPTIIRMVREILNEQPHFQVIGEAPDGAHAVALVEELEPDVVVLNVVMPKMSGFEAARKIHAQLPSVSIVILSTHKDAQFIAVAKQCGASAYVQKQDAGEQLVDAIEKARSGEVFFLQ